MAHFTGLFAIVMLVILPIFVTIYARGYLRIRRFVAENPVYQNRGEADSNESPEYLKELFKTVLLLVIVIVISYVPMIATTLAATILSIVKHTDLKTTNYLIFAHTASIFLFANSFLNALIILYRNKKSKKWLKERLHSCCKQRKKEEEQRSPEVIVNIGIEDLHATSTVESNAHFDTATN